MTKTASYLIQLIATALIVGGGIAITCYMTHGEHCLCGWMAVLLGVGCLVIGTRRAGYRPGRKSKRARLPVDKN